jgi:hypothetical protein
LVTADTRSRLPSALPQQMPKPPSVRIQLVPTPKIAGRWAGCWQLVGAVSVTASGSILTAIAALCHPLLQAVLQRGSQAYRFSRVEAGPRTPIGVEWVSTAGPNAAVQDGMQAPPCVTSGGLIILLTQLACGLAAMQAGCRRMLHHADGVQFGQPTLSPFADGVARVAGRRHGSVVRGHVAVAAVLSLQFNGASPAAGQHLGPVAGETEASLEAQARNPRLTSVRLAARQAVPASTVANLLGAQPDLSQGNWASIDGPGGMIEQARFAGVRILRVGVPDPDNWAAPHLQQLATAGLKLSFVAAPYVTPEQNVLWIKDFLARFPDSVAFVEGPNVPNNFAATYAGETGIKAAVRWQADFYAAMKSDPATARIPIYGLSSYPKITAASDVNNLHVYPVRAGQARGFFESEAREQIAVDPGKPWGITEFGYFTIPGFEPPGQNWEGVDEATQAKLLANAYFDAASLGAKHFIIFNLRDWCSTRADDVNAHFGLFRCENSPKPAAQVFRNIATALADHGKAFRPDRLSFGTNASAQVRNLLLQRSDGSFVLVFWRTPDLWDEVADRPIDPGHQRFTLQFGAQQKLVQIFDPLASAEPVWSQTNTQQIAVAIGDHPVLVVITSR